MAAFVIANYLSDFGTALYIGVTIAAIAGIIGLFVYKTLWRKSMRSGNEPEIDKKANMYVLALFFCSFIILVSYISIYMSFAKV